MQRPRSSKKPVKRSCGWSAQSPGVMQDEADRRHELGDAGPGATARTTHVF